MKRNSIFAISMAAIISAIASFAIQGNSEKVTDFTLYDIEALSACEVSADPSLNKGYCVKDTEGKDVCIVNGPCDAVRCSGNI